MFWGGLFNIIFFGGGLLLVYLIDKEKLDWKFVGVSLVFVAGGIFMIMDSDTSSGETIVMETGNETFHNNDTIIAGNYEYTARKIGTENTIDDYGTDMHANGEYLIVEFSIKNNSNHPFTMDINMPFYLKNGEQYFESDYNLSNVYTRDQIGNAGLWGNSNTLNPGNENTSYVIFDVPEEIADSSETQLLIPTDDSAPNNIYIYIN